MKTLKCKAVLSKEKNHLMYFTLDDNILNKTEWLKNNAYIRDVILHKNIDGNVTFHGPIKGKMSFSVYDYDTKSYYQTNNLHCESTHFLNLELSSFYYDVYHHDDIKSDYDLGDINNLDWDIINLLPHGSGINFNYSLDWLKNGKLRIYNAYDGMNENGFYCHVMDFMVTCHFNHLGDLKLESVKNCNNSKEYTCCSYDIKDYLYQVYDFDFTKINLFEILKNG